MRERLIHTVHQAHAVALDRGIDHPRERDVALVCERAWNAIIPRDGHHAEAIAEAAGGWKATDEALRPEIPPWERNETVREVQEVDASTLGKSPYAFISQEQLRKIKVQIHFLCPAPSLIAFAQTTSLHQVASA